MIRYQELVPDYYVEKSRDFQVLCRMYDYALNSLKYNIDSMKELTDTRNIKDTVLPLLGDKFGIYDKEAYSNRQLLEALPIALKYKGSLKSVYILLNAFLDSMDIFETALALHSKDEESAAEIAEILNRNVKPYSIIIILSSFPSLTNLHILDTYLNMVIPSGLIVEYSFGIQKKYLDKFKYKEYTFLFYTYEHNYNKYPSEENMHMKVPYISMIANKDDEYSVGVLTHVGTDNIVTIKEYVGNSGTITHTLKYKAVPIPPSTSILVYELDINPDTGETTKTQLVYSSSDTYTITIPEGKVSYIEYSYSRNTEFISEVLNNVEVNSVSLGTVMSKDQYSESENIN